MMDSSIKYHDIIITKEMTGEMLAEAIREFCMDARQHDKDVLIAGVSSNHITLRSGKHHYFE